MFSKLNKIGELTKILSVKSKTCDAIIHFMACFGMGSICLLLTVLFICACSSDEHLRAQFPFQAQTDSQQMSSLL